MTASGMASKGTGGHDGTGKEKYIIMGAAGMRTLSYGGEKGCVKQSELL